MERVALHLDHKLKPSTLPLIIRDLANEVKAHAIHMKILEEEAKYVKTHGKKPTSSRLILQPTENGMTAIHIHIT